ncbi:MAG: HAD family phosphatase, partial [Erysipelotrichia bacterium]|nr:HAD family phosphatase [Erysipelotrichia bacterium]
MIDKVRLVIADIDGTLTTEKRELTPETRNMIEKLHENGVYFGIASGRSVLIQLMQQYQQWGFERQFDILIGMNGSELLDNVNGQFHSYYKLKRKWMKEIVEMMAPLNLNPFMYYKDGMLISHRDDGSIHSSIRNEMPLYIAKQTNDLWAEENAKILFRVTEEQMPEVEAWANAHPSPYYQSIKTQTTMLEFTDKRVSKAVALKYFCEYNHFPLNQVIAFGDMSNDDEMLKAAGWGVC